MFLKTQRNFYGTQINILFSSVEKLEVKFWGWLKKNNDLAKPCHCNLEPKKSGKYPQIGFVLWDV